MGYDSNTGKYTFDFDSVDFPIHLSENLINYLYINYKGNRFNYTSLDEFRDILSGKNKSQNACRILSSLFYAYNKVFDPYASPKIELPPADFDILSDEIISTITLKTFPYKDNIEDTHQGVCVYNNLEFDFEYKVKRKFVTGNFEELKREKTTVVLKGHSFEVTHSYMHEACSSYLEKEKEYEDNLIKKQIKEEEEEKWIEFRLQHKQELIEWLSPLVIGLCSKVVNSVNGGYPSYDLVESLDRGFCHQCSLMCPVKKPILEKGTHTDKWYKLGIDKLNITNL